MSERWFSGPFILQSPSELLDQEDELLCAELKCSLESRESAESLQNLPRQVGQALTKNKHSLAVKWASLTENQYEFPLTNGIHDRGQEG